MQKNSERINLLDYIRGYLILCIVVNHFFLFPSAWEFVTGRGILWVSAAEGFFFMSGLMVGLIQGRRYKDNDSIIPVAKRILKRSWVLYVANFVLVMIFIFIVADISLVADISKLKVMPEYNSILLLAYKVASLQVVYGWADFLNYYVVFLILSIPALWLLKQKMWYFVLALALVGWIEPRLAQFGVDNLYFYWQAYFFFGLVFGYHYENIQKYFRGLTSNKRLFIKRASIYTFLIALSLNWAMLLSTKQLLQNKAPVLSPVLTMLENGFRYADPYLNNNRSGILRVFVFFVWAIGIYFIFKHFENFIEKKLDWLLGELGRQSLRYYIVSSLLALVLPLFIIKQGFLYNTIITTVLVALVLIAGRIRFVKKIVPN